MKKLTQIKNEKACYYVEMNGTIYFESESLSECKKYLCKKIKQYKKELEEENELYNYFIGMYAISIAD